MRLNIDKQEIEVSKKFDSIRKRNYEIITLNKLIYRDMLLNKNYLNQEDLCLIH